MTHTRLLFCFGGRSSEHEVSVRSATEVLAALDRTRFEPLLLALRRDGQWRTGAADTPLSEVLQNGRVVHDLHELAPDLVFPVLHGPYGEDGTFQGMLEVLGLPYVGSGVLASALCMDKAAQKHYLSAKTFSLPMVPWIELHAAQIDDQSSDVARRVQTELGYPCFVKPANMGSSIGVSRVREPDGLDAALRQACRFDSKLVVERGISAREIEVALLGNGGPETIVSAPGEIGLPPGEWYDYDTKYLHDAATLHVPAVLPTNVAERARELALTAFRAVDCTGFARVDFLVDANTFDVYLNEINTIPGFTPVSMYPKLMEHAGIPYRDLISRLCELALAYHETRVKLSVQR